MLFSLAYLLLFCLVFCFWGFFFCFSFLFSLYFLICFEGFDLILFLLFILVFLCFLSLFFCFGFILLSFLCGQFFLWFSCCFCLFFVFLSFFFFFSSLLFEGGYSFFDCFLILCFLFIIFVCSYCLTFWPLCTAAEVLVSQLEVKTEILWWKTQFLATKPPENSQPLWLLTSMNSSKSPPLDLKTSSTQYPASSSAEYLSLNNQ